MKFSTVEVEKKDVEKLKTEQLRQLIDISTHPGLSVLKEIAGDAIQGQLDQSIANPQMSDENRMSLLNGASFMKQAWVFLFDATERAKKELEDRKPKDGKIEDIDS